MQCMDPETSGPIHDCAASLTSKVVYLSKDEQVNADQIIPAMCCASHQGVQCVISRAEEVCKGKVPDVDETSEFLRDAFSDSTSEMIEMFCGRYSGVEHCKEHIPDMMNRFEAIDAEFDQGNKTMFGAEGGNSSRTAFENVLFPLIDLLGKFQ